MHFVCKEISICDEEFGCAVTFSANEENEDFENQKTVDELIDAIGQYVMLQRTYGDDEFEKDYFYFETSDYQKSGGLDDFEIILTKRQFILTREREKYTIQIDPNKQEWNELKKVLKKLTEQKGRLNINETAT